MLGPLDEGIELGVRDFLWGQHRILNLFGDPALVPLKPSDSASPIDISLTETERPDSIDFEARWRLGRLLAMERKWPAAIVALRVALVFAIAVAAADCVVVLDFLIKVLGAVGNTLLPLSDSRRVDTALVLTAKGALHAA